LPAAADLAAMAWAAFSHHGPRGCEGVSMVMISSRRYGVITRIGSPNDAIAISLGIALSESTQDIAVLGTLQLILPFTGK
jgi:hypothetical protein